MRATGSHGHEFPQTIGDLRRTSAVPRPCQKRAVATRVSSGPDFEWVMNPPTLSGNPFGRVVAPPGVGRAAPGRRRAFLDSCRSCRQRSRRSRSYVLGFACGLDLDPRRAAAILSGGESPRWVQISSEPPRPKIAKWGQSSLESGADTHPKSQGGKLRGAAVTYGQSEPPISWARAG